MAGRAAVERERDNIVKEHKKILHSIMWRLVPDFTFVSMQHRLMDQGRYRPYFVVRVGRIVDISVPKKDRPPAIIGEVVDQIQREYAAAVGLPFPLKILYD